LEFDAPALDLLLRADIPSLSEPNSGTNKGKEREEILEQARDHEEEGEKELLNFEGDLQLPIQFDDNELDKADDKSDSNEDEDEDGDEDGDGDGDGDGDEVLTTVRKNAERARRKMVDKYSKTYTIEVFA
jgi:hypothetical protein